MDSHVCRAQLRERTSRTPRSLLLYPRGHAVNAVVDVYPLVLLSELLVLPFNIPIVDKLTIALARGSYLGLPRLAPSSFALNFYPACSLRNILPCTMLPG